MKTTINSKHKSLTLIIGVIVALIAGLSSTTQAGVPPGIEPVTPYTSRTEVLVIPDCQGQEQVEIYNREMKLVYKGTLDQGNEASQTMINRGDLFMTENDTSFYLIKD